MKKKHFLFEIILKDIAACNSAVKNGIFKEKKTGDTKTPCHFLTARLIILCLFPLADCM